MTIKTTAIEFKTFYSDDDAGRQVKLDRGITASGAKETPALAYG